MEEPETTKTMRRKSRRAAGVCFFLLGIFILVVIGNIVSVGLELNRASLPPFEAIESSVAVPNSAIKSGDALVSTTLVQCFSGSCDAATSVTLKIAIEDLLPVRANVPDSVNRTIRGINVAYRKTLDDLAEFQKTSAGLSCQKAAETLNTIRSAWSREIEPYYYGDPRIAAHSGCIDKIRQIDQVFNVLLLDVAVRDQEWLWAAGICRNAGWGWPAQVYYYKKLGKKGGMLIAMLTTQRYWTAISGSVMSIGPDFHLPRFDNNY